MGPIYVRKDRLDGAGIYGEGLTTDRGLNARRTSSWRSRDHGRIIRRSSFVNKFRPPIIDSANAPFRVPKFPEGDSGHAPDR
jgi:hypothetical protein